MAHLADKPPFQILFPDLVPISRAPTDVQLHAKALLAQRGWLYLWPTRDRIDHILFNRKTLRIHLRPDRSVHAVQGRGASRRILKAAGLPVEDCYEMASFDQAPHYQTSVVDYWPNGRWMVRDRASTKPPANARRAILQTCPESRTSDQIRCAVGFLLAGTA